MDTAQLKEQTMVEEQKIASTSQDVMQTTGEHAQPPQSVAELERQGYVTVVSSGITIQPGTDLQHVGPITPVPGVENETGSIHVADKPLTGKEELTLSDSKLWKNMLEKKIELEKVRQN